MTEVGAEYVGNIWPQTPQGLCELFPHHERRGLIGNYQIEALRCCAVHSMSLGTASAGHHLVAQTPQYGLTQTRQGRLVVDEEHPLCPTRGTSQESALLGYLVLS